MDIKYFDQSFWTKCLLIPPNATPFDLEFQSSLTAVHSRNHILSIIFDPPPDELDFISVGTAIVQLCVLIQALPTYTRCFGSHRVRILQEKTTAHPILRDGFFL